MTDKEYKDQKRRVQKYFDKWFNTLGLGWFQVDIDWDRSIDEDEPSTAAKTTWRWQYRSANIRFYMPTIVGLSDEKLENIVVHEFSHILTGSMVQNAPDDNQQLMEYGTECVARAIIWAREAGRRDK